ncbi:Flp pilus assembly protein CpaB [Halomonas koreensis]|uniref:Flp pilus assembly protein CpaB n=1 Tax=Halomonas koreensis TaxID=245385 RepID=A0ABU1G293_9GAMM|nr:Flp pilus assembly protein CpaB [Halomonas koreensis]MDR5867056.1 Flp pilus assembly protein CpaB [Halomonas koreensis]
MSPNLLKGIAALLVAIAIGLAFAGWRMAGQVPETVVEAPVAEVPIDEAAGYPVLTAARRLPAGTRLDAPGEGERPLLRPVDYPEPLAAGYQDIAEVEGRVLTRPLAPGDVLRPGHFAAGGLLAEAVPPGKRAIAVGVDEVVGGGGFVAPGDRVDVFFFARDDDDGRTRLARRLLRDIEVLSYGDALRGQPPREDAEAGVRRSGRTAVLALSEDQAPRLLLAEETGRLRLAVIGAEERRGVLTPIPPGTGDWLVPASLSPARAPRRTGDLGAPVAFDELVSRDEAGAQAPPAGGGGRPAGRRVVQQVGGEVHAVRVDG